MDEKKTITIKTSKNEEIIVEPVFAKKVEEEDRALYLVSGIANKKDYSYFLLDKRKNVDEFKNIEMNDYSEEEKNELFAFFRENGKDVDPKELQEKIGSYDTGNSLKDVLSGNYAGFARKKYDFIKIENIECVEVNKENEIYKIKVEYEDGKVKYFTGEEVCKNIILDYASQEKKDYDKVAANLLGKKAKEEEKPSKKRKIVKGVILGATALAVLLAARGCHVNRAPQTGYVPKPTKKVSTETPKATEKPTVTMTDEYVEINSEKEEEHYYTDYGNYYSNMEEISDWVTDKKSSLDERPYFEMKFYDEPNNVLFYFNEKRSSIVFDAYYNQSKSQTKTDIKSCRDEIIDYIYGDELFDKDVSTLHFDELPIEDQRELMNIALSIFSIEVDQKYTIDGQTFDNDDAFDKLNDTNNNLYLEEYGRNK